MPVCVPLCSPLDGDHVATQLGLVVVISPVREGGVQGTQEGEEASLVRGSGGRHEAKIRRDGRGDGGNVVGLEASDVVEEDGRDSFSIPKWSMACTIAGVDRRGDAPDSNPLIQNQRV